MRMAARGWAAVLLLAAVFLGHGLQCGSAADSAVHAVHGGDDLTASVALTATDAHPTGSTAVHGAEGSAPASSAAHSGAAPVTTAGSAPGHWHGLPGHLWAVCLAVLATGLAFLLAVLAPRLPGLASCAAALSRLRGVHRPAPLRPPDPFSLCVQRI